MGKGHNIPNCPSLATAHLKAKPVSFINEAYCLCEGGVSFHESLFLREGVKIRSLAQGSSQLHLLKMFQEACVQIPGSQYVQPCDPLA